MSLFDEGYFSDAITYAQKKLGVDTGANAVQTIGNAFKKDDSPAAMAIASSTPPIGGDPIVFAGMTQKQLIMLSVAGVLLVVLISGKASK